MQSQQGEGAHRPIIIAFRRSSVTKTTALSDYTGGGHSLLNAAAFQDSAHNRAINNISISE